MRIRTRSSSPRGEGLITVVASAIVLVLLGLLALDLVTLTMASSTNARVAKDAARAAANQQNQAQAQQAAQKAVLSFKKSGIISQLFGLINSSTRQTIRSL
jgi:Flp pilus assembly protein TadG